MVKRFIVNEKNFVVTMYGTMVGYYTVKVLDFGQKIKYWNYSEVRIDSKIVTI